MKVKVLASGSKGNATLVKTEYTALLIDAGISYQRMVSLLLQEKVEVKKDIKGILLTHSHTDHTKGLNVLSKYTSCPIYVPKGMEEQIKDIVPSSRIVPFEGPFSLEDIQISALPTSHDVSPSVGYILENQGKSLLYMTDTGYINERLFSKMKDKSMYVLESNHDTTMLMNGPYPRYLKERVDSDNGHLSNRQAATYLSSLVGEHTHHVILAHLSEKNNTEDLAYQTVSSRLKEEGYQIPILLARQEEPTELIEV